MLTMRDNKVENTFVMCDRRTHRYLILFMNMFKKGNRKDKIVRILKVKRKGPINL